MDILKYLDVLIGLTVVMILLSPAVTAFTQLFMFVFNRRSQFLRKGLAALIQQIGGSPVEKWVVTDSKGQTVADPRIEVVRRDANALTVSVRDATNSPLQDHKVSLTLMPRGADEGERFESGTTDTGGVTSITYLHAGSIAYTASTATVTVLDTNDAPAPGADIVCLIKTGPKANTSVPIVASRFTYPEDARPAPAQYQIECTVTNKAGPQPNLKVRFDFDRNNTFDRICTTATTRVNGQVSFQIPAIDSQVALVIAEAVLHHPMICKADFSLGWLKNLSRWLSTKNFKWLQVKVDSLQRRTSRDASGEVVQREELTRILLEFAAKEGAGELKDEHARKALIQCLKMNGIPNPGKALSDIRSEAQRLEKEQPTAAAHARAAEAIITAAKSDYVGRINAWFDQTMDRVTQRYGMQARVVTIFGAFIVAFAIQVDSLDLLRRLSVDDKLRNSLLTEAKAQEERIDRLSKPETAKQNKDELETVKAARDDIQQNLTKLRAPQMAILPDHFIWQHVPQARLVRNPTWRAPYPSKFELVLGSTSYTVSPRWRRDILQDLRDAIDGLKAPVSTRIEIGEGFYLLTARDAKEVNQFVAVGKLTPVIDLARARLTFNEIWPEPLNVTLHLMLDDRKQPEVVLVANKRSEVIPNLMNALKANTAIAVESSKDELDKDKPHKELLITSLESSVHSIQLLNDRDDPFSNVLNNTERITRSGKVTKEFFDENKAKLPSNAIFYRADSLVLTSHGLGKLELRYTAGRSETNILNEPVKADWATIWWLLQPSLWGIILSWLLLSLGAPFWYDRLKDLLKLRSSLASKEESQRKERQTDTTPTPGATTPTPTKK